MWIAQVNGYYREGGCISTTAKEAAERAVEIYNEDIATQGCDDEPLTLEVYRCDPAELPRVGYDVVDTLMDRWADAYDAPALSISAEARAELEREVDELVAAWAARHAVRPDWYVPQDRPTLTVEIVWCEDEDGVWAVVGGVAQVQIEALDVPGDAP